MSSEVWKIGQKMSAEDMYKDVKENGVNGNFLIRGEIAAVNQLTLKCKEMLEAYNDVIEDQNEYLIELENENDKLEELQKNAEENFQNLLTEIKELENKKEKGNITEEEQKELDTKKGVLDSSSKESNSKINDKTNSIKTTGETKINDFKTKEKIAENFGSVTVEKGTPLAETKVSHGFFKKLFGKTGKNKKAAGEKAVTAGNDLLDKVSESYKVDDSINKVFKKYNSK